VNNNYYAQILKENGIDIIDWTPYGIASIPAETLDASKIVRLLVVSVLTLVITIGINKITFDKAELK